MVDSFRMNNESVGKFEHWNSIFAASQKEPDKQIATAHYNSLVAYAMRYSSTFFYTAVLPVVVVPDDLLWKVTYDDDGNISLDPERVKECEFYVSREIKVVSPKMSSPYKISHVHFFKLSGFNSFLSKMTSDELAWNKLFTGDALEI